MKKAILLSIFVIFACISTLSGCGCAKPKYYTLENLTVESQKEGYTLYINGDDASTNEDSSVFNVKQDSDFSLVIMLQPGYVAGDNFRVNIMSAAWKTLTDTQMENLDAQYDALIDQGLTRDEIFERSEFKEYKPFTYTSTTTMDPNTNEQSQISININNLDKNVIFMISGIEKQMVDINFYLTTEMNSKFLYSVDGTNYNYLYNNVTISAHKYHNFTLYLKPANSNYEVPNEIYYYEKADIESNSFEYYDSSITKLEEDDYEYTLSVNYPETSNMKMSISEKDIYDFPIVREDGSKTYVIWNIPDSLYMSFSTINNSIVNTYQKTFNLSFEKTSLFGSMYPVEYYNGHFVNWGDSMYANSAYRLKANKDFYFRTNFSGISMIQDSTEYSINHTAIPNLCAYDKSGNLVENAIEYVTKNDFDYYYKIKGAVITQDLMIVDKGYEIVNSTGNGNTLKTTNVIDQSGTSSYGFSDVTIGGYNHYTILNYDKITLSNTFAIRLDNIRKYDYDNIEIELLDTENNIVTTLRTSDLDKNDVNQYLVSYELQYADFCWENFGTVLENYTYKIKQIPLKAYTISLDLVSYSNFAVSYRVSSEEQIKADEIPEFTSVSDTLSINNVNYCDYVEIIFESNSSDFIGFYFTINDQLNISSNSDGNKNCFLIKGEDLLLIEDTQISLTKVSY